MTLFYGHRGAKGEVPENTLASFQHCLQQGISSCELDLHLSKDQVLMVIHDPTLKRTTGISGKVHQYTAQQLERMDARHNGPHWATFCPIPTLETLFKQCRFAHWQLEVKTRSRTNSANVTQQIQKLVTQYQLTHAVTITSSSRQVLAAAKQYCPEISRGLVAEYATLDPVKVALRYGCTFLVLNKKLCSAKRIERAHRFGLHVSAWTINTPQEMRTLMALGVDSLITDYPSVAVKEIINNPLGL